MLVVDSKSAEPRIDQIKRQIEKFTRNTHVKRTEIASMDQMTDLIDLVKEFGEIPLGNNTTKS